MRPRSGCPDRLVDQGTPEGDPAKLPPPATWPVGWTIGKPNAVFEMPEPYTVKADGALPYQHFRVATGFTEDRLGQGDRDPPR